MGGNGPYKPNRIGKKETNRNEENDGILQMEPAYGRIRTELEFPGDINDFGGHLICTTCGNKEGTKGSIKRHLARSHRDMGKVKDVNCPYCEDTFAHLGSLNRHIYISKNVKILKTCF